jgi:hypothetical protein
MTDIDDIERLVTDALTARAAQVDDDPRPLETVVAERGASVVALGDVRTDGRSSSAGHRRLLLVACAVLVVGTIAAAVAVTNDRHGSTTIANTTTSGPSTTTGAPTTTSIPASSTTSTVPALPELTSATLLPTAQMPAGSFWGGYWHGPVLSRNPITTRDSRGPTACEADVNGAAGPDALDAIAGTFYGPDTTTPDRTFEQHIEVAGSESGAQQAAANWIQAITTCPTTPYNQVVKDQTDGMTISLFDNAGEFQRGVGLPYAVGVGQVGRVTVYLFVTRDGLPPTAQIDTAALGQAMRDALTRAQAFLGGH